MRPCRLTLVPLIALLGGLALGAASPAPATADVAVLLSVSPRTTQPGRSVEVTIGCGGCKSAYIVNGPAHPPPSFPVLLVPAAEAARSGPCPNGEPGLCAPGSVGPPRGLPFVAVGRARPMFRERDLARTPMPSYRLRFQVPQLAGGEYAFVLYCSACYDGPRGSLISEPRDKSERLRVLAPAAARDSQLVTLLAAIVGLLGLIR